MNYSAKIIEGKTIDELKDEIKQMYEYKYRYGYSIDKCRLWDINYTIVILESNCGEVER